MSLKPLCILLLASFAASVTASGQNFLNGSFEAWGTAACDINTPPDSWVDYSNGGIGADEARFPGCPSTIPSAAQNGAAYARFYAASTTTGEGIAQTVAGFSIGISYQVRYYYCGSNLYGGTADNVVHLFLNGTDVHQSPVFSSSLSTWTLATYDFTATAASNTFGFRVYNNLVSTGSGALDNLSIGVALPEDELSLYARAEDEQTVRLTWHSGAAADIDHFSLERMREGGTWEAVAEYPVATHTPSEQAYMLLDTEHTAGKYYYRLLQIDNNGAFSISEAVGVQVHGTSEFTITPNPADRYIHIQGLAGQATGVIITDALGRQVPFTPNDTPDGMEIVTKDLENGLYFLSVTVEGVRSTKRFRVAR